MNMLNRRSDDFFAAIRSVHRGNLVIPQELAQKLMQPPPSAPTAVQFIERELDVLRLLVQGKSNPEIGQELFISATTVRSHVTSILTKLNVANRTQAALVAQERSWCRKRPALSLWAPHWLERKSKTLPANLDSALAG